MSNTVDNRVVEMQFKNEDFERGVKQTITSLDGLKKALEINTNSLDLSRVQREADKLNLERVTSSIEALTDRFSTLGIVGMATIQRLTNGAINLVEKLGSASIGQILTGGKGRAQKVADARFKLEGLMRDFEDSGDRIKTVFNSASEAVNDTAFGLDEAVNISAMLVGSGVEYEKMAGEVSDLDTALMGIAGAAAMSNSSFEDIGRIFAQVKTAGRLMGQDMMQLQGRTINVTAEIAKYLKITQAEVQEMVHKGEIDFNTFAAAMNNSFGAQAKKSNETLQGVLSNVRSALSRIGEIFYSGIIENKDLISFFGDLKSRINDLKKTLEPLKEPFANLISSFSKLGSAILGTMNIGGAQGWTGFINLIAKTFEKISSIIDAITNKIGGFVEDMHLNEAAEEVKETVEKIDDSVQTIKEIASTIWFGDPETGENPYGNGQTRVDALGNMYDQVQAYVNAMKEADFDMEKADQIYAQNAVETTNTVTDAKQKEMEARLGLNRVTDQSVENAEKTSAAFSPLLTVLGNIMKGVAAIGRAFKKVFSVKDLKASIGQLTSSFGKVVSAIGITEERASNLESFFTGLFSVFKMVGDTLVSLISGGFEVLARVLPTIIDGISRFIGFIGDAINSFREFVESNNLLVRAGRFVVTTFTKITSTLKEFFSKFIELPAVQKLKEEFIDIYDRVGAQLIKWFGDAQSALGDFFGVFDDADDTTMNKILGSINDALETMMSLAGDAKGHISDFFARFKAGGDLENTAIYLEKVNGSYINLKKTTDSLAHSGSIGEFVSNMSTAFGTGTKGGVLTKAEGVLDNMVGSFKKLDLAKMTLIGLSGSLVAASISFSVFTFRITDAVKNFSEMPKALTGVFKSISGAFKGVQDYFKRKGLAQIITQAAIAIGAMALALAGLAIVGSKYDLDKPTIALGVLMGLMSTMVIVLADLTKSTKSAKKFNEMMDAFAKILLSMSGAIFLVAAALSVMSEIKWDKDAWISLGVVAGIMAALIGVMLAISKLAPEVKTSGLWLIFYAGSVYLLVKALNQLAKLDVENLGDKFKVLAKAMGLVALIAIAASHMSFGKGLAVLSLIGSIVAIEIALKWVIKYGLSKEDINDNFESLKIALIALGGLAVYMIVVSNFVRKPEGIAASIIATIVSIIAISRALKSISQIPTGKLIVSTIALGALMLAVMGMIYTVGMYGQAARVKQAGTTILKVAAALAILGLVVTFLGYLDKNVVEQGLVVVKKLTGLMAVLIMATSLGGKIDPKAFIGMMGVMATMALLISLMSFIKDKEALFESMKIFSLALISFGASMWLASMYAKKTGAKPIMSMVTAMLVIGGMLIGLTYLNKGDYLTMLSAAASLSMVLLALGRCAQMMISAFTKKGVGVEAMKRVNRTILMMTAIIATVGLVLTGLTLAIGKFGTPMTAVSAAASLTIVLAAIAGVLYFMQKKLSGGKSLETLKEKVKVINYLLLALTVIGFAMSSILYFSHSGRQIVAAAASLTLVLAALTGVYWALDQIKGNGKTMIAKAGALVLASLALIPAAAALSLLAKYDMNGILSAGMALGLVIMALAAALAGLTMIAKSGGAGVMIAVAFAVGILATMLAASVWVIAKAMDIVVESINKLSEIKYDNIDTNKLGELVGLLLQLSLTSIVTSIGISAISASLVLLGGALAIVGIGVSSILLSAAVLIKAIDGLLKTFERVTKASDQIARGIHVISNALTQSIKDIAVGMALGFALFVQTLSLKAVIIGTAIKNFLLTVIDIISEIKIDVERKVIESVTELFEMLEETLPELFRHFNNTVLACMAELAMSAQMYGYFGAIIASEFAIGLMAGLASKADALIDEATYLALSIIKALKDTFDEYKDTIGSGIEEAYSNFAAGYWDLQAKSPLAPKKWKEFASQQAQFMRDNAESVHNTFEQDWERLSQEHADRNAEALYGAQNNAIANYDTSKVEQTTANKQNKILNQSDTAGRAAEDTVENFFSTLDGIDISKYGNGEQYKQYFFGKLLGTSEEATENAKTILVEDVKSMDDAAIEAMKADGYRLNEEGTAWIKEISNGAQTAVEGKEGDATKSSITDFLFGNSGLMGQFTSFSDDLGEQGDSTGDTYIDSLVNSLSSDENINKVIGASSKVGNAIDTGVNSKEGIDVNSPSKKAIHSANSVIEGLLYITSATNTRKITTAAASTANLLADSLNSTLSDNTTAFTPTIRPVLDTNNMGQYRGFMDILNNPTTVQLAADSQLAIKDNNQMQLANQVAALQASVDKLANTDFSHMMDGVNINVNADTTVDGTVLRKTASNYTIRQINKEEMGYMMATGGRY